MQGENIRVSDVIHVPELVHNLISVTAVTEKCMTVIFKGRTPPVKNESTTIFTVRMKNSLWVIDAAPANDATCLAVTASAEIWHQRYNNLNYSDLIRTSRVVDNMKITGSKSPVFCEPRSLAKCHKLPHAKIKHEQSSDVLDIVHADLHGPMHVPAIGGVTCFCFG